MRPTMTSDRKLVATIVVTYNRKHFLLQCVRSLLAQSHSIDCIYIIDNNCTDGTLELLEAEGISAHPRIRIITLSSNTGGAGGFSHGMRIAYNEGYQWVWVMDDDAVALPDTLANLLEVAASRNTSHILGVCPRVINYSSKELEYYQHKRLNKLFIQQYYVPLAGDSTSDIDGNAFVGPIFHRTCFAVCGFPNDRFFIWVDDLDFTYRIACLGSLILAHNTEILHQDPSPGKPTPKKKYYGSRNFIYFLLHTVPEYAKDRKYLWARIGITIFIQGISAVRHYGRYRRQGYSLSESLLPLKGFFSGLLGRLS